VKENIQCSELNNIYKPLYGTNTKNNNQLVKFGWKNIGTLDNRFFDDKFYQFPSAKSMSPKKKLPQ